MKKLRVPLAVIAILLIINNFAGVLIKFTQPGDLH